MVPFQALDAGQGRPGDCAGSALWRDQHILRKGDLGAQGEAGYATAQQGVTRARSGGHRPRRVRRGLPVVSSLNFDTEGHRHL